MNDPPQASDWQAQIVSELGGILSTNVSGTVITGPSPDPVSAQLMLALAALMPSIWSMNADKALVYPRLQYWYTKRQAIEVLEGQLRIAIQASLGPISQSSQQKFDHLKTMHDQATAEIAALYKLAGTGRAAAIGQLTQTAPIMPADVFGGIGTIYPPAPNGLPLPNSPIYTGNPATPWWFAGRAPGAGGQS